MDGDAVTKELFIDGGLYELGQPTGIGGPIPTTEYFLVVRRGSDEIAYLPLHPANVGVQVRERDWDE